MFKCDVTFVKKEQPVQNGRQEADQLSPVKTPAKDCYISTGDYQLIFYDIDEKKTFFRLDTGGLISELDLNSNSLTLSKKRKGSIVKISADSTTLEKLDKYCKEFSDESILWSPLVYRPASATPAAMSKEEKKIMDLKGAVLLCFVVVFYSKLEDVVENIYRNGIMPTSLHNISPSLVYYALSWVGIATLAMMAFEKLAFKGILSNRTVGFLQFINIVIGYLVPIYYIRNHRPDAVYASVYVFWTLMVIMKMISYTHFMHHVRNILPKIKEFEQKRNDDSRETLKKYISKENLEVAMRHLNNPAELVNIKDVLQLYCFPTFVYQFWYPRTTKIDWKVVRDLSIKLVIASVISYFWTNQFMVPALREASDAFRAGSGAEKLISLLRLTNSFAVLMPINTYLILHLFPYLLAELTRFDDRDFYQDWWNSPNVRTFWSRWNRSVHKWCQRHIYFPLQSRGYSQITGLAAVFLFSSFMHEYLMSVPYGMFTCYAMGMMSQVPIIMLEIKYRKFFDKFSAFSVFAWLGLSLCCLAMIQYHVKSYEMFGDAAASLQNK